MESSNGLQAITNQVRRTRKIQAALLDALLQEIHMTLVKIIAISIVFWVLQGCSASGPIYSGIPEIKSDEGILYIYRPSTFLKFTTFPFVYVNGEELGALRNGGYIAKNLKEGKNKLEIKGQMFPGDWMLAPVEVDLDVKGGQATFVKMWFGNPKTYMYPGNHFITTAGVNVAIIDNKKAKQEIKKLKYSN